MSSLVVLGVLQAVIILIWQAFTVAKLYEKYIDNVLRTRVSEEFLKIEDDVKPKTTCNNCAFRILSNHNKGRNGCVKCFFGDTYYSAEPKSRLFGYFCCCIYKKSTDEGIKIASLS